MRQAGKPNKSKAGGSWLLLVQVTAQGGPGHQDALTHPRPAQRCLGAAIWFSVKLLFLLLMGDSSLALGSPSIQVHIRETEARSHKAQSSLDSALLAMAVTGPAAPWTAQDPSNRCAQVAGGQGDGNQLPTN